MADSFYDERLNDIDFNLGPIIKPLSIAVIGIFPENRHHHGNIMYFKNSTELHIKTYGISTKSEELDDPMIFSSIHKLPAVPDLAIITLDENRARDSFQQAAEFGIKGAIITGRGFAETGRSGQILQAELVNIGIEYNIPFLGPNCAGVYNPPFIDSTYLPSGKMVRPKAGNVAVISQSLGFLMDQFFINCAERNIGICSAVSIGNKAMITETSLVKYFNNDKNTDVIAFYLEGFHPNGGRRFCEIARKSRKDVVVFSGGLTKPGQGSTEAHTGSTAPFGSLLKGVFKQHCIIHPETEIELTYTLKTYSLLANPFRKYSTMTITGENIAILSFSGGHGVICADLIEEYGLGLAEFNDKQKMEMLDLLSEKAGKNASLNNPIDITENGTDEDVTKILQYLLNSKNVEMILLLLVPQGSHNSLDLGQYITSAKNIHTKPIIAYVPWTSKYEIIRSALEQHYIPCTHTIEGAVQIAGAIRHKGQGGIRKKFGHF